MACRLICQATNIVNVGSLIMGIYLIVIKSAILSFDTVIVGVYLPLSVSGGADNYDAKEYDSTDSDTYT